MKILILFLFILLTPILASCQVYKVTGTDLTPQLTQLQKTNDSLKTIVASDKLLIARYKKDSVNYFNWVGAKNAQMWLKVDSIKALKASINPIIRLNDSLKLANYNIQYDFAKYRAQQFADTIEFIGFPDTSTGTYTKITEKEYSIAPKFTWQILKRYPIVTAQGIKTKEVTITELKK